MIEIKYYIYKYGIINYILHYGYSYFYFHTCLLPRNKRVGNIKRHFLNCKLYIVNVSAYISIVSNNLKKDGSFTIEISDLTERLLESDSTTNKLKEYLLKNDRGEI